MIAHKDQIIPDAFARFVDLQQQHSHLTNKLAELEVNINREAQAATGSRAEEYIILQEEVGKLEIELELLFKGHPEWRKDKAKTVETPYGSVAQRESTKLVCPNPVMTVALIKARGQADPKFDSSTFLHIEENPNLQALAGLSSEELSKLGLNRVTEESITVKPAKVDVAKTAKKAKAAKGE